METNNSSNNTLSSSSDSLSIFDLDSSSLSPSSTLNFPKYPSRPKMAGPRHFFLSSDTEGAHHHFLDSCHLCKKPIGGGRDIFMYRGDTPFCSEECRQEQIEIDEDDEKRISRSKKKEKKSMGSKKSDKIDLRVSGAIVAV